MTRVVPSPRLGHGAKRAESLATGPITGVRHAWTFDEKYSAFAVQGVGADGVPVETALKRLGEENVKNLGEYDYFTFLRVAGIKVAVRAPKTPPSPWMTRR